MINIFRMDLHRLLHSMVFYACIVFLTIMAVALVMSAGNSVSIATMLGAAGSSGREDFLNSTMGAGVILILLSIILTQFVCHDYSSGFAKNIFTTHADPWDYIGGKLLSTAVTSALMLVLYTIETLVALAVTGDRITLAGGVVGLIFFIVQKWLVSCAFSALVLLVNLLARNSAVGIIAGFLVATGGLTMGISLLAGTFNLGWLLNLFSFTISGSSQLCTLTFSGLIFLRVLLASAAWTAVCSILSKKVLASRDV